MTDHISLSKLQQAVHRIAGSLISSRGIMHARKGLMFASNGSDTMIQFPTPLEPGSYNHHASRLSATAEFSLEELRAFFSLIHRPDNIGATDLAGPASDPVLIPSMSLNISKVIHAADRKCNRPILRSVKVTQLPNQSFQYRATDGDLFALWQSSETAHSDFGDIEPFCLPYDAAFAIAQVNRVMKIDKECPAGWIVTLSDDAIVAYHPGTEITVITKRMEDLSYPTLHCIDHLDYAEFQRTRQMCWTANAERLALALSPAKRYTGKLTIPTRGEEHGDGGLRLYASDPKLASLSILGSSVFPAIDKGHTGYSVHNTKLFYEAVASATGTLTIEQRDQVIVLRDEQGLVQALESKPE